MVRTLPLYDPAPPHPDGWHRVVAPGGYETWHFDAEDVASDRRIVATFSQGSPFDGVYRRRFAAFLRNPMRRPPPMPAEYPSVSFLLWEKGETLVRVAYRYSANQFDASPAGPDVRIGAHRVLSGAGGTLALTLADVPLSRGEGRASAELWFAPKASGPPVEKTFPSREASEADHRWVIANPLCAVSGTIRLTTGRGDASSSEVRFAGRGYHDHRYGSAPPVGGGDVKSWLRGRLLRDDRAEVFHFTAPAEERCFVTADSGGIREVSSSGPSPQDDHFRQLELGGGLVLKASRVVDASDYTILREYEAVRSGRREGVALCEVGRRRSSRAADFEDAPASA